MPAFQFVPYRSDLTGTIADLISAPGRIRAQALRAVGDIRAREAEAAGQRSAQLAQTIGQLAQGTIGSYLEDRAQAPVREAQGLQLQNLRDEAAGRQAETATRSAAAEAIAQIQGGNAEAVLSRLTPEARRLAEDWLTKTAESKSKRQALLDQQRKDSARLLRSLQYDPTVAETVIGLSDDDPELAKLWPQIKGDPQKLKALVDHYADLGEKPAEGFTLTPGQQRFDATGKPIASVPKPEEPPRPVYRLSADKRGLEQVGEVPAGAQVVQEPQPPRVTVNTPGNTGGLTPEGVEFAATQYRITGNMPPLGMASTGARTAVVNEAAKQTKELRQTPAAAIQRQAAYKSDGAALTRMRTLSSGAEAFEQKALSQADIVADLSERVGRTAYPILNRALLAGKREVVGDPDTQLLYNAITTFSSEYAKIMEGSTGSAQASSDASRKAAGELIKASLNKATMARTLDLMKREMRLTIQGYDATIAHITERMGGQVPKAPEAAVKNDPLGIR